MSKGYLNILILQMDNRIQSLRCHIIVQQVFQPVTADNTMMVIINGQTGVQIRIITQHGFDELRTEVVIQKQRIVGFKKDIGTVLFVSRTGYIAHQVTFFEYRFTHLSVAHTACHKAGTQRIDSLGTYSIQTDTLLECLCIIFSSGIQHRHRIDKTSQRNIHNF